MRKLLVELDDETADALAICRAAMQSRAIDQGSSHTLTDRDVIRAALVGLRCFYEGRSDDARPAAN